MPKPTISFEFFPPKTEQGVAKLKQTRKDLLVLSPAYYSVTFGAGGSTRDGTLDTIAQIQHEGQVPPAPHISCIGSSKNNILELLDSYQSLGVNRLVCLRGDIPSGMGVAGEFHHANELVAFIREQTGDYFHIEVAAYPESHPESENADDDIHHFKQKIEAGADGAITQYFYNIEGYLDFIDRCQKLNITTPIVPGIMPITNYEQLARFSKTCGADIPRWLAKRLQAFGDDLGSIRAYGLDVVTRLCQKLLDNNVPGLHFYTLNQSSASVKICEQLDLD